jgi:uncharacterized protein YyaL (SSP411 family)
MKTRKWLPLIAASGLPAMLALPIGRTVVAASSDTRPAATAPATQASPPAYLERAHEVSQYIQETFWDERAGLYKRSTSDARPDFMWPNGVAFSSLVAAARHAPRDYRPVLDRFFTALNAYWDANAKVPGYEPAPTRGGGHDKYYDDNAWLVIGFLEAFELTRDRKYLVRAEETLKFVLSGWDEQLGGGIWWHEAHKDGTKNTCSNAPAALGCLRLARIKGPEPYLGRATKIVRWTLENLQDKDGLFDDRKVVATGEVKKGKLTYNTALMIRSLLGLYRHTGKAEFLEEAKRVGKAGDWFLGPETGAYRDDVKWSHLMVEADLELFRATGEEYLLERARKNAEYHYSAWAKEHPKELMPNASIARLLWLMADAETPVGKAFWEQADRVGK